MMTDAEIMEQVRSGKVLKYCGRGVVVINYDWWLKMCEKEGFRIVPTPEQLKEAMKMRQIDANTLKAEFTGNFQSEYSTAEIHALIDLAPTVGGWISVKKKLPDVDGLYLVYGMTDAMRELLPNCVPIWICDYYQEHGFYSFTERMHFDYITHWMPLPEPPKDIKP